MRSTIRTRSPGDPGGPGFSDIFTRMFPNLPAFAPQTDAVRAAVQKMGESGGIMDPRDNLTDPIRLITEPATFSPNNPGKPSLASGGNQTAGMTFLGQFIEHDVTLDARSAPDRNADPNKTINFHTAAAI